ncbi:MAG: hypothetical protein KME30_31350 [Iphinoe sp. HA4291-MV1]|jgi:hypothetical protein|nr:hypothetical protein [Iphinoe sp. HA4291-MV1]
MLGTYCALSSALSRIEKHSSDHPLLLTASQQLHTAASLAKRYHDKQWSIYWQKAKVATKTALQQELQRLAFDTYTSLLTAMEALDAFADAMQQLQPPPPIPRWCLQLHANIHLAYHTLLAEHSHEHYAKQLSLFNEL